MIEYKIPFDPEGDLGRAYDIAVTTSESPWVALLDHDVMMMHPNWQHLCEQAIRNNPSAGIFTCWTNKIGSPCQKVGEGMQAERNDMKAHRALAHVIWYLHGYACTKLSEPTNKFSGFFLLVCKEAFLACGGAQSGFFGVDWKLKDAIVAAGYDAFRIDGLYAFHLRDREPSWIEGQKVSKNFNP